ncbi:MAG: 3-hydroxyacyl-CoA dehydrogenase NAD-binding domain-containing protein, partial [Acidobacteria bacterium]|nr:3-hydroxyacyl-CoA dehydrogenase NAD-binding domain-containing protein [Acidobacteriota bacterium]
PGAGGTQRLPRIVGVERALEIVTSGDMTGTTEALESGLIDAVVDGDLTDEAVAFAKKVVAEGGELKKIRDLNDKVEAVRGKPEIFAEFRRKIARKTRGFLAPEYNVQCIEAAVNLPFDEGIAKERELFGGLVTGEQSRAQRYYFFAEREAAKVPDVPRDTEQKPVASCGILGAGTMGGGIAMNFANVGIPVTIVEANQENLDRGLGVIRKNYERTAKRGRLSAEDVETRMALITPSLEYEALADKDIVIEAVFENMDLKKEVFERLDGIVKEGAILATNTSALDINEIAAATRRPEDVIVMHFFSPANIMRLLEIVRGAKTSKEVIATSMAMGKKIGKIPVLVGVCKGFVGNRMLAGRGIEANKLILEGATPSQVDDVLYEFGFPMGPFAMSDLAGLDIGWQRETSTSSTIREVLCEQGRLGQKSGRGFYTYNPETRAKSPDPEVEDLVREFSEKAGIERREVGEEEILERCLYPMVNEGARILEEEIAIRSSDIDVVWVNGYGWPVYRGGPMFWADSIGLDKIVARMDDFKDEHGDHWEVAGLLRRLAEENLGFSSH